MSPCPGYSWTCTQPTGRNLDCNPTPVQWPQACVYHTVRQTDHLNPRHGHVTEQRSSSSFGLGQMLLQQNLYPNRQTSVSQPEFLSSLSSLSLRKKVWQPL